MHNIFVYLYASERPSRNLRDVISDRLGTEEWSRGIKGKVIKETIESVCVSVVPSGERKINARLRYADRQFPFLQL